jgi:hypothetical protein
MMPAALSGISGQGRFFRLGHPGAQQRQKKKEDTSP